MAKEKKVIAFDLGDVALTYNIKKMHEALANVFAAIPEEIRIFWSGESYFDLSTLRARSDTGLPALAIYFEFIARFGPADQSEFMNAFVYGPEIKIIEGFLEFRDIVAEAGNELIVLSNMCRIHRDFVLKNFSELFDPHIPYEKCFFSCDIGITKHSDPRHFHAIAKKINYGIESLVLIDDRPENIRSIVAAGGDGIVHTGDFEKITEELTKRKVI